MASKSLGLDTLDGHSTHISLLWVVALLAIATFVTVAIYVYAGEQQDLGERHFNKVKVDGRVDAGGFIETDKTLSLTRGGAVTQATNHTTAVSLNSHGGQITLASATVAEGASFTFTVNNNKVDDTDVVIVSTGASAGAEQLQCTVGDVESEKFKIKCNNNGAAIPGHAGKINFVVVKNTSS